ncbi:hypothetical protein ACSAGD_03060 [Paramicrobacterium sp. CJ85]|uniref:hypothetical protein n=1 Tax=Paramicrobacterium sp. CJ85 TaxID=3445355 RepID=UPI003F62E744
MSDRIPPMPDWTPTNESIANSAPQEQMPTAQPPVYEPPRRAYSVPPEQQLVYESTPDLRHPVSTQTEIVAAQKPHKNNSLLFAAIGAAVGLAAGLLIGLVAVPAMSASIANVAEEAAPNPFEVALDECGLQSSSHATIGDDGASLELQTMGEDATGMSFDSFDCVVTELGISDAVMNRIENTRALDGRQEASWDDFTASWTYHPDNGLNMLVELTRDSES